MATGLHLATVAFSVRNVLALRGSLSVPEITGILASEWHRDVDQIEVNRALDKLLELKLVVRREGPSGFFAATSPKPFTKRQASGAKMLAEDDPKAWEGWH